MGFWGLYGILRILVESHLEYLYRVFSSFNQFVHIILCFHRYMEWYKKDNKVKLIALEKIYIIRFCVYVIMSG